MGLPAHAICRHLATGTDETSLYILQAAPHDAQPMIDLIEDAVREKTIRLTRAVCKSTAVVANMGLSLENYSCEAVLLSSQRSSHQKQSSALLLGSSETSKRVISTVSKPNAVLEDVSGKDTSEIV